MMNKKPQEIGIIMDEIDGCIRFKSRCVTLGYMMVPGVDFTERFSPVATDGALKLQIAITLYNKKKGRVFILEK